MLREIPSPMWNEWIAYFVIKNGGERQSAEDQVSILQSLGQGTWEDLER